MAFRKLTTFQIQKNEICLTKKDQEWNYSLLGWSVWESGKESSCLDRYRRKVMLIINPVYDGLIQESCCWPQNSEGPVQGHANPWSWSDNERWGGEGTVPLCSAIFLHDQSDLRLSVSINIARRIYWRLIKIKQIKQVHNWGSDNKLHPDIDMYGGLGDPAYLNELQEAYQVNIQLQ